MLYTAPQHYTNFFVSDKEDYLWLLYQHVGRCFSYRKPLISPTSLRRSIKRAENTLSVIWQHHLGRTISSIRNGFMSAPDL